MKEYKNYFFPWQHSTAIPVHSFIMGVPTRWVLNTFEKDTKYFQSSYVDFDQLFDVSDTLLKLIWYILIIFSFHVHRTWSHSYKAVQQGVPLIATHMNDKAEIIFKNQSIEYW